MFRQVLFRTQLVEYVIIYHEMLCFSPSLSSIPLADPVISVGAMRFALTPTCQ